MQDAKLEQHQFDFSIFDVRFSMFDLRWSTFDFGFPERRRLEQIEFSVFQNNSTLRNLLTVV